MRIDSSEYTTVEEILSDIKTVDIQGATNVAIATIAGMKLFSQQYTGKNFDQYLSEVMATGDILAEARANEPLAKNGVKFVKSMMVLRFSKVDDVNEGKLKVMELCNEYLDMIRNSKKKIIEVSKLVTEDVDEVFTHCHSSTVENVIIALNKRVEGLKALCTETRPLYQGHKTATNLVNAGVDTTMIADSGSESFIIGRGEFNIDMIFIGADEITMNGDAINKIGSWGVALAAYYASKPIYVVTPLLKADPETAFKMPVIEKRDGAEVWKDAPKGLKLYNPSFDLIDSKLITGYITEVGIVKPEDIARSLRENYEWVF